MKVAQPFAFPHAVGEGLDGEAARIDSQHVRQPGDDLLWPAVEGKQRLQLRMRPQPELAGRGLEDRVVTLVRVRHRLRAELEAGLLDALGIESVEGQCQRQLWHSSLTTSRYLRPRRRSR